MAIDVHSVQVNDYVSPSRLPASEFVINPYVGCPHRCIYCYAEFMRRFTHHVEPWGTFLDIKECRRPINVKKLAGKRVILSSVTDAYNPFEREFGLTRTILEQLVQGDVDISIVTKSDLVLRDLDLFKQAKHLQVAISMNTLDDSFRKDIEPGAPSIERRLKALRTLHEEGIHTVLFMSPIFPVLTDVYGILAETHGYIDTYWFENLNLRGGYRPRVMKLVSEKYPQALDTFKEIYEKKDISYWEDMSDLIPIWCDELGIADFVNYFYHEKIVKKPAHRKNQS